MKRSTVVLALLPLVLVTGCVTRAIREKQEQLCKNLATMNTSIAVVRRVSNTSQATAETLKQAEERVTVAFRDVKAAIQDAPAEAKANIDELEKAYEELDKTVKQLPDKSTIDQARASLTEKVTTVESAIAKTQSGLRCPA